ncbi:hypothetical protein PTTG_30924, partial [Puccinia triticina 1-1 BBBD Race 1]
MVVQAAKTQNYQPPPPLASTVTEDLHAEILNLSSLTAMQDRRTEAPSSPKPSTATQDRRDNPLQAPDPLD